LRDYVAWIDTADLPWSGDVPGIRFKQLSVNPGTQARTVLLRLDPEAGYVDQPSAHYHSATEELLILAGRLSFDQRTWYHRGGYVFHPPGLVHGFASKVPECAIMLARSDGPASTTFIPRGEERDDLPYYRSASSAAPTRPLAQVPSPWTGPFDRVPAQTGTITRFTYSQDAARGERSSLLRLGKDACEAQPEAVPQGAAEELLVLSGSVEAADGAVLHAGHFACYPAGHARSALKALGTAEVFHSVFVD